MDKYEETFNTWNKVAAVYQDKFMDLEIYNDSYNFICNLIEKPNASLLDVGCGPGNITKYLLSERPDFDILGIDVAPNMIQLAKKNNPTANFALFDSRNINRLENKYDGIIVGFCLPYLSATETREFISNAFNILNKNGILYLSFVEGNPQKSGFKVGSGGRVYFHYHKLKDLKILLTNTKFDLIKTFKVKYKTSENDCEIHTILTARKQ